MMEQPVLFRMFRLRVPEDDVVKYGSLKVNGENCMDTVGHKIHEGVGVYSCHGQGGNQVNNKIIAVYLLYIVLNLNRKKKTFKSSN